MARVLVVDDDPDFVEITRTVLRGAGHEVVSAANGSQALKVMRSQKPDIVLLDIMMSYVLDGLDVTREMSQDPELKSLPVLIVSSLTGVEGASEMFPTDERIAADGWLSKPVDPQQLLKQVDALLARGA